METDNCFIYLSSTLNNNDTYDNCNFQFKVPLQLKNHKRHIHQIAVMRVFTYLNMVNILNGATLTYAVSGVNFNVVFTEGYYDMNEIEATIHRGMLINGHNPALFSFEANLSNNKLRMRLSPTMKVDFTLLGNTFFSQLFGFTTNNDNTAGLTDVYYNATNTVQLNYFYDSNNNRLEINKVYIHCDVLKNNTFTNFDDTQIRQNTNGILYSFSLNGIPNGMIEIENNHVMYMNIPSHLDLSELRLFLTNEKNEKLRGVFKSPVYYDISLKKVDDE